MEDRNLKMCVFYVDVNVKRAHNFKTYIGEKANWRSSFEWTVWVVDSLYVIVQRKSWNFLLSFMSLMVL